MAVLALIAVLASMPSASAVTTDEATVLGLSNRLRSSVGVPSLAFDETLAVTARRWAATVAARGEISHNPDFAVVNSGPTGVAENVGVGPSIQAVHDVLVASHGHYLNLVNPLASRIGIGVAWSGDRVYVVEDFVVGWGTTSGPSSSPAAAPTTAPAALRPPPTVAPAATRPANPPASAVTAPPGPGAAPPAPLPGGPSAWLALSFDILRGWNRADG